MYGPDGQPLYSWRVLILPYIEQDELFKEFHLDEPWDSEHNIKLLERMPKTYAAPGSKKSKLPPNHTVCHAIVGPGTAFEGRGGIAMKDFPDGTSNTLLFVEAGEPVPWTKPENVVFAPGQPMHLKGLFNDGFRACMADGSRRFVKNDIAQERLKAAVTRNGGEKCGLD